MQVPRLSIEGMVEALDGGAGGGRTGAALGIAETGEGARFEVKQGEATVFEAFGREGTGRFVAVFGFWVVVVMGGGEEKVEGGKEVGISRGHGIGGRRWR